MRILALGLVIFSAAARAQSPAPPAPPPDFRASATLGIAARDSTQNDGALPLRFSGLSPTVVHVAGAYFFLPWLGVALDGSFETFVISGKDLNNPDARARLLGWRGLAELAGRWSPLYWVGLELHLGYSAGAWPGIALTDGNVTASNVGWHGPSFGFTLALEPSTFIGGQLFGHINPALGGDARLKPLSMSSGLQLHFGDLQLGNLHGAIVLEGELIGVIGGQGSYTFNQLQIRTSLGIRVRHQEPAPTVATLAGREGNGRIRGRVVTAGIGLANVTVLAGVLPQQVSSSDGDFEFADVPPGKYTVKALLAGYKPFEQVVDVPRGDEAVLTIELRKPTGPGRIKGTLKGDKDAPVEGAEVTAQGRPPVKSAADGSFTIEQAGPGAVKVAVTAKGYQPADEAVQVPAEGVATLDLVLLKAGAKQMATIRGSVKAANGKSVRGTVKISEVNQTIAVKGDGRFVVQVPGGKYTLTIEAAGYVTQVKTVEVADGDQAIFHCDLQPAGR